ncbi:MAG: MYG1 family protein [Candidatus Pacebacteria bacterium]|nr:MYG1 family protein [Candidatus Paceibacterota bacterium]
MKTLVTHNGKFHADDILACAVLQLVLDARGETYSVIRTRDPKTILEGDFVFDVGGEYDAERNRFDHHQLGGAGKYESDIPYASIGLVWKQYGEELCGSAEIAGMIEDQIVIPVDADDNGVALFELKGDVAPFRLQEYFYSFRPTWKEGSSDEAFDAGFLKCVAMAKELITRQIKIKQDNEGVVGLFKADYDRANNKKIIELSEEYPWEGVATEYPDTLFVVYPRQDNWRVGTVRKERFSFENRKDLPASWAGLRDVDLQAVTGVSDAIFCHNGRFLAVAKTRQGAVELAKRALEK